jgi:hypothetical protein
MVLFGNQDLANVLGQLGVEGTFRTVPPEGGDGNKCMIDYTSDPNLSYFYYDAQFLQPPFFFRLAMNKATGSFTNPVGIPLPSGFQGGFVTVGAMNPADQKVFALAVQATSPENQPINQITLTINRGSNYAIVASTLPSDITAMVWSNDGSVLYAVNERNVAACAFTSGSGSLNCVSKGVVGASVGPIVRSLAVNPDNTNEVYAATTNSDLSSPGVFVSTNGGSTWEDITIPSSPVDSAAIGGSVAYIKKGTTSAVVVGTSNGVHVFNNSTRTWILLASDLPKVPIMDMLYEQIDDRLVMGTLGRGVWYLDKAGDVASFKLTGVKPPLVLGAEYNDITIDFSSIDSMHDQVPPIAFFPDEQIIIPEPNCD